MSIKFIVDLLKNLLPKSGPLVNATDISAIKIDRAIKNAGNKAYIKGNGNINHQSIER